ncbi:hypothetical protein [Jeotgalibacillus malaysiensis]|uniref:hypothetical protein n=1 Tax=Jeotgalibacillus malaysiensis TaxID=1508404 RepID=UPI0038516E21
MLNNEILTVQSKSKKYKKFLEKIEVNRNPVSINGKHYYEVIYTNRKGEVTATAILSPDQETESEARQAHPLLARYNGLILNIVAEGRERTKVSEVFFKEPLELISRHDLPQLEAGRERINRMGQLVENHRAYYEQVMEAFRSAGVISQKDIDYATRMAISMELVHIEVLEMMTNDLPVFEQWVSEMQAAGLWEQLGQNVREFYHHMLNGKEENEALLATKERPKASDWENRIEELHRMTAQRLDTKILNYRKDLRYPEPW